MTDNWQFMEDAAGRWLWQHTAPDGTVSSGAQGHASRTDCIADAMRHGYLALDERPVPQTPPPPAAPVPIDRSPEPKKRT